MQRCYNLLTDDELQMIHEASLDVLETTGLRIDHPLALEKLSGAGARVDAAGQKVRLPAEVVEKALQTIPKHFVCAGRTPEFDVTMSPGGTRSPVIRSGGGQLIPMIFWAIHHARFRFRTAGMSHF